MSSPAPEVSDVLISPTVKLLAFSRPPWVVAFSLTVVGNLTCQGNPPDVNSFAV
ncbi:hypothetical protein HZM62_004125 [Salmonella enterica]|nr:hypothetical protein [Salmonella enterica]